MVIILVAKMDFFAYIIKKKNIKRKKFIGNENARKKCKFKRGNFSESN